MHTMCLHLTDSAAHREWHSVITLLHACDRGAFMPAVWLALTFEGLVEIPMRTNCSLDTSGLIWQAKVAVLMSARLIIALTAPTWICYARSYSLHKGCPDPDHVDLESRTFAS